MEKERKENTCDTEPAILRLTPLWLAFYFPSYPYILWYLLAGAVVHLGVIVAVYTVDAVFVFQYVDVDVYVVLAVLVALALPWLPMVTVAGRPPFFVDVTVFVTVLVEFPRLSLAAAVAVHRGALAVLVVDRVDILVEVEVRVV